MLEILKQDMQETVQSIQYGNITLKKNLLKKQLALLENLEDIYCFKKENSSIPKSNHLERNEETERTNETKETVKEEKESYRFERKLRGGFVPEVNGYVPEGVVRYLGLEHGDQVYATPKETTNQKSNHFIYQLAEKGDGKDDPKRMQYNFCPVVKEAGRLIVEKSSETGEFIRYDEGLYLVVLSLDEVFDFRVSEGDLIDIAFPINRPEKAKIIWKHETTAIEETNPGPTKKMEKTASPKPSIINEQTLMGRTILVIGNEPMKSIYRTSVEERGGEFLWADAKYSLERLEALVRKSDICVFLLSVSGHIGMEHIKQMCKNYDVPFETTWSNGKSSVVRIAEETETVS